MFVFFCFFSVMASYGVIAKTDFPLYTVRALDEKHFLVAGGGGPVKTGVANALEIFDISFADDRIKATSVNRLDTGNQAVMNSATYSDGRNHLLAIGMDNECHLYSLKYKVVQTEETTKSEKGDEVRHRKRKKSDEKESLKNGPTKMVTFDVESLGMVYNEREDEFQKVVRFSPDGSLLFTGSTEGILRAWEHEKLKIVYELNAHSSDIDDLAVCPNGKWLVTISKDNSGIVWNAKDGKKHTDLKWTVKQAEQYRFRGCCFGCVEGNKDKINLYTINIPSRRAVKPLPCYISKWDSKSFTTSKSEKTGTEILSALSVSADGDYLGLGTISGSVSIYISFSLQRLYHVPASHGIFVTGVEFLPISSSTRDVTGKHDFSLLTISPDYMVQIHQPSDGYFCRFEIGLWLITVGALLILALIIWLLGILGY